jgi:Raf kinase inhibitor-like YbhB/YbcL family protein
MRLFSDSVKDRQRILEKYAFAAQDPEQRTRLSQNLSPHIAWDGLPQGTKSLVLICHDPDVPESLDDVNQEGREVPADLPRTDFYHWVLVDIQPALSELREAGFSQGIVPRGKKGPQAAQETRQGLNDYTELFKGDAEMEGYYYGYDGPFPPWNDAIPHRYIFTLYALDIERCPVEGAFTGPDVLQAIEGHVLDKASLQGSYTLNPDL